MKLTPRLRLASVAPIAALTGCVLSSILLASPPSLVEVEIDGNAKCHFAGEARTCQDFGRYLRDKQHVSLHSPIGIYLADTANADTVQVTIESLLNADYLDVRLLPANQPQTTTPNYRLERP